jgi:hypothetical protein
MEENRMNIADEDANRHRIDALSKRIFELETETERLKKLIKQVIETGPNNDREFQGWEVMNALSNWAQD